MPLGDLLRRPILSPKPPKPRRSPFIEDDYDPLAEADRQLADYDPLAEADRQLAQWRPPPSPPPPPSPLLDQYANVTGVNKDLDALGVTPEERRLMAGGEARLRRYLGQPDTEPAPPPVPPVIASPSLPSSLSEIRGAPAVGMAWDAAKAGFGLARAGAHAATTAVGEEIVGPLPGHEQEQGPDALVFGFPVRRMTEHAKKLWASGGEDMQPSDPAVMAKSDSVWHMTPADRDLWKRRGRPDPGEWHVPTEAERIADEVARGVVNDAFTILTDPTTHAAAGISGIPTKVLGYAFATDGMKAAYDTLNDPEASRADKILSVVRGTMMAGPVVTHAVIEHGPTVARTVGPPVVEGATAAGKTAATAGAAALSPVARLMRETILAAKLGLPNITRAAPEAVGAGTRAPLTAMERVGGSELPENLPGATPRSIPTLVRDIPGMVRDLPETVRTAGNQMLDAALRRTPEAKLRNEVRAPDVTVPPEMTRGMTVETPDGQRAVVVRTGVPPGTRMPLVTVQLPDGSHEQYRPDVLTPESAEPRGILTRDTTPPEIVEPPAPELTQPELGLAAQPAPGAVLPKVHGELRADTMEKARELARERTDATGLPHAVIEAPHGFIISAERHETPSQYPPAQPDESVRDYQRRARVPFTVAQEMVDAVRAAPPAEQPAPASEEQLGLFGDEPPAPVATSARYTHKGRDFDVTFANPIDETLYHASSPKATETDKQQLAQLSETTGASGAHLQAQGVELRAAIKAQAASAEPGVTRLDVPASDFSVPYAHAVQSAGAPNARETDYRGPGGVTGTAARAVPAAARPDNAGPSAPAVAARPALTEAYVNALIAHPRFKGYRVTATPEGHIAIHPPTGLPIIGQILHPSAFPSSFDSDHGIASFLAEANASGTTHYRMGGGNRVSQHPLPTTLAAFNALPRPHQEKLRSRFVVAGRYNPDTDTLHISEDWAHDPDIWAEEHFHAGVARMTPEEKKAAKVETKAEEEAAFREGWRVPLDIYARPRGNLSSEGQPHGTQAETDAVSRATRQVRRPDGAGDENLGTRPDARGAGRVQGEARRGGATAEEVARRLADDFDRLRADVAKPDGGFTYSPYSGSPTSGYALSVTKGAERILDNPDQLTSRALTDYIIDHAAHWDNPRNYIGAWHNPKDGKVYLDVSTVVKTYEDAERLGTENQQLAYYDLKGGRSYETKYGERQNAERLQREAMPTVVRGSPTGGAPTLTTQPEPSYAIRDVLPRIERAPQEQKAPGETIISTRVPDGPKAIKRPPGKVLETRLSVLAEADKKRKAVWVQAAWDLPILTDADRAEVAGDGDKILDRAVERMADNLEWLWDQYAEWRDRARQWYAGAHYDARQINKQFPRYKFNQIVGVIASLSPRKDWYQNVELAKRVIAIVSEAAKNNRVFTKDIYDTFAESEIAAAYAEAKEDGLDEKATKALLRVTRADIKEARALYEGKAWHDKDMDDLGRARMVRGIDGLNKAPDARHYPVILPEGDIGGLAVNTDGSPTQLTWQSYPNIAKAVSILRVGTPKNIDLQLGDKHKVRSFYNNILAPWDARFVTMDTHAIGANLLLPVSTKTSYVKAAMGGPAAKSIGLKGTSVIHAEAVFRTAERLSKRGIRVLPREVQSVTWEAVRGLYTPGQKRQRKKKVAEGEAAPETISETASRLLKEFNSGTISRDEYLASVLAAAGGIRPPTWVNDPSRLAPHQEGVSPTHVPGGRAAVPAGRRDAGRDPGGATGRAADVAAGDVRRPGLAEGDAQRGRGDGRDDIAPSYSTRERQEPDAQAGSGGGVAVSTSPAPGRPAHNADAQDVAHSYNAARGLPPVKHDYATVDEPRARAIADAYDALPEYDRHPRVAHAYAALSREIRAQWDHITKTGVVFEPWTKDGQPYQNSTEMADDIRRNKHLYFFTGGEPHPFMDKRDPSTGLTDTETFRAVHDYFGHAAGGFGFGARGEESAWIAHSQMFSPAARRAMTTETRGQNSWTNFGRHNYNDDGSYKHVPPAERPYAQQKVALLPAQYVSLPGENEPSYGIRDTDAPLTLDKLQREATKGGVSLADAVAQARAEGRDINVDDYFNFKRVNLPDEELQALKDHVIDTAVATGRVPKERVTFEETLQEAKELDPSIVETQLERGLEHQRPFRAVKAAARQRVNVLNREIYEQTKALATLPSGLTADTEREIAEKRKTVQALLDLSMRAASEAGRGLAMHRMEHDSAEWDDLYWLTKAKQQMGIPPGVDLPDNVYADINDILRRGEEATAEARAAGDQGEPPVATQGEPPVEEAVPPTEPREGSMTRRPRVQGPVLPPIAPREGPMTRGEPVQGPVLPPEESRGRMTSTPPVQGPVLPPPAESRGRMTSKPPVQGPVLPPRESRGPMTRGEPRQGPVLPKAPPPFRLTPPPGDPKPSDKMHGPPLSYPPTRGQKAKRSPKEDAIQLELFKYLNHIKKTSWPEAIGLMYKAGLLTGAGTHLINAVGNLTFQGMEEVARIPAAVADMLIATRTGQRTVQGMNLMAVARAGRYAATTGLKEASATLRTGTHDPDELRKIGGTREMNTGKRILDVPTNAVFRVLAASDRIFKSYAYQRSMEAQAAVMSKNLKGTKSPEQLLERPTQAMVIRAIYDADFATFNNKNLIAGGYQQMLNAIKRTGGPGEAVGLGFDVIIPFSNTPANIVERMLDYAGPLSAGKMAWATVAGAHGGMQARRLAAAAQPQLAATAGGGAPPPQQSAAAGGAPPPGGPPFPTQPLPLTAEKGPLRVQQKTTTQSKAAAAALMRKAALSDSMQRMFAEAFGRGMEGAALLALGGILAAKGLLTGMADEDPGQRNVQEAAGRQPGSVLINGHWIKISNVAPFGGLLTLGASLYERRDSYPKIGMSVLRLMKDQPMLAGISALISGIDRPQTSGERAVSQQIGAAVPTIVSDVAATFDPWRRDAKPEEFVEWVYKGAQARVPGWRNTLPLRTDIFGEPIPQSRTKIINPTNPTADKSNDPVIKALLKYKLGIDVPDRVDDLETADQYRERRNRVGKAIRLALREALQSDDWADADNDEARRDVLERAILAGRNTVPRPSKPVRD